MSYLRHDRGNAPARPIRPVLRPSTSASIAYRVNAWFLTVITILLGPPILAALTYSSWLRPRLELSVFVANHAASLPFALTVLSAHGTLLCFVYACFFMRRFIGLDTVITALNRHRPYHRSHISRMRLDRFNHLKEQDIFTVFILGAKTKSTPILVSGDTTINHILQILSASGLIPLKTENHYISTSRARRLGGSETMASFGAGNLTHLYLRSSFFGGSDSRAAKFNRSGQDPSGSRPRRSITATAKVTDPSNSSTPVLTSHKAAADARRAAEARKAAELEAQQAVDVQQLDSTNIDISAGPSDTSMFLQSRSSSQVLPSRSTSPGTQSALSDNEREEVRPPKGKRKAIINLDTPSESSTDSESIGQQKKKSSKRQKNKPRGDATNEDSIFSDIEVTSISTKSRARREDASRDIREFFDNIYTAADTDGKTKQYRNCKICSKKGPVVAIVQHNSTLHRHIESAHVGAYNEWCKHNNFTSKLPNARKAAKQAAEDAHRMTQSTLDGHLQDVPPSERVIPYSDKAFREAAVEWLIATDQPIQALEHPSFHKMIGIAARATNGVTIPNRKATREEIMDIFKTQMTHLKNRFNSDAVTGEISLTCDAWQASNTDGYFAVTGHWIEESRPGVWEIHSALLGFTRLNNAHNGRRLGGALFNIVDRLGIAHRIGHITCDNASNNNTMMEFFAKYIEKRTKKPFPFKDRRIRCLAHVINLATQALIKGHSNAKYYNPATPDEHIPDVDAYLRDEVGLIRAIAVKERSSAKWKELFRTIQSERLKEKEKLDGKTITEHVKQLILDMPIRWSSTYGMLHRAVTLRESVDTFVSHMARDEPDRAKRGKLDSLQLSDAEWERVNLFLSLLKHADAAQQAFSSENGPSLHLALPALEALHKAWSLRARKDKYSHFESALDSAIKTIAEYYDKTSTSDAFIMSMLLHPKMKMRYFTQYWPEELHNGVRKSVEKIFKECHEKLSSESATSGPQKKDRGSRSRFSTLLHELDSSDEDEASDNAPEPSTLLNDATPAWLKEFNLYFNTTDEIPEGQTIMQWWGINAHRYPVWASLARDYLLIMASSVSSERAFSSAGITISKRRNRLKGDIVEALQCLKCMIRQNLIFRFDPAVSIADEIAEEDDIPVDIGDDAGVNSTNQESATSPKGWSDIWLDLEDEAANTEG